MAIEKAKAAAKPEAKKEKVCIVGCSDSKRLTPFNNQSFEFWGVNNLYLSLPQIPWSRWFEIHEITFDGTNYKRRERISADPYSFRGQTVNKYIEGLKKLKCPIYMQKHWDILPNSIEYPLKQIVDSFGDYLTNTISLEIALAIYEGFKEIHIYGVDMAVASEYGYQRPSCEYFIGIALGKGIKVVIPPDADLCKQRFIYGFEENKERLWVTKMINQQQALKQRQTNDLIKKEQLQREIKILDKRIEQYTGGQIVIDEGLKIWDSCERESWYQENKKNDSKVCQGVC